MLVNEILFLTAVHGDEKLGYKIFKKLEKENLGKFNWLIANEKAFKLGRRFIDVVLNRIAPGRKGAKEYERRRAFELLKISKKYRYVIDVHDTKANTGIFTIVTNPKLINLFLASVLPIKNVVIWASNESKESGPITQFVDCGVEIEAGPRNSSLVQERLYRILKSIIKNGIVFTLDSASSKNWFQVYGKLTKKEVEPCDVKKMKDFKKTMINGETFFPLLIGEYEKIVCYKMQKINFWDKFSY
jgi:hypothetical protein